MSKTDTATHPKEQSTLREMLSTSLIRLVSLPVGALCTAATASIVIGSAGSIAYGYVSLVSTLFLLFAFLDLGLAASVINDSSELDNDGAVEAAPRILLAFLVLGVFSAVLVVLILVLDIVLNVSQLLIDQSAVPSLEPATTVVAFLIAAYVPLSIGQRILVGRSRNQLLALLNATIPVLALLFTLALANLPIPAGFLAVPQIAAVLLVAGFTTIIGTRSASIFTFNNWRALESHLFGHLKHLARVSAPYFVVILWVSVSTYGGRLILSVRSSPDQLASYSLAFQFFIPTLSVITVGSMALWPRFRRTAPERKTREFARAVTAVSLLGALAGLAFACAIGPVAHTVSGGEIEVPAALALGMAVHILFLAVHQPAGLFLTDESGLRFQAGCCILLAVTFALTAWFVVPMLGSLGVVLAGCVATLAAQLVPGYVNVYYRLRGSSGE